MCYILFKAPEACAPANPMAWCTPKHGSPRWVFTRGARCDLIDSPPIVQRAPAKGRILDTANELFYEDGIRNVGVDRIITASSVTKATFYKHYRAKDNLIVDYITAATSRRGTNSTRSSAAPRAPRMPCKRYLAAVVEEISRPGFRGCAFINAAAEFPDADAPRAPDRHGAPRVVHRRARRPHALARARDPGDAADELLLARDGAMTGGYAGDPIAAAAALTRVASRVVAEATWLSDRALAALRP